jgi:hypothetical protein
MERTSERCCRSKKKLCPRMKMFLALAFHRVPLACNHQSCTPRLAREFCGDYDPDSRAGYAANLSAAEGPDLDS